MVTFDPYPTKVENMVSS